MQPLRFRDIFYQLSLYMLVALVTGAWVQQALHAMVWLGEGSVAPYSVWWTTLSRLFRRSPADDVCLDEEILPRFSGIRLSRRELLALAARDSLTTLLNRPAMIALLDLELMFVHTDRSFLAVILVDIDGLDKVNEFYGRQMGDEALRVFAHAVQDGVRCCDYAGRYGEDEFLILIGEDEAFDLEHRLDLLHRRIAQVKVHTEGHSFELHCSLGTLLVPLTGGYLNVDIALTGAEGQLAQAKSGGGNRSCYRWFRN